LKLIKLSFLIIFTLLNSQQLFAALDAAKLKKIKHASVYIIVESGESGQSGSGFLIHKDDMRGIIVTNAHVVNLNLGHQEIHVFFNSGR